MSSRSSSCSVSASAWTDRHVSRSAASLSATKAFETLAERASSDANSADRASRRSVSLASAASISSVGAAVPSDVGAVEWRSSCARQLCCELRTRTWISKMSVDRSATLISSSVSSPDRASAAKSLAGEPGIACAHALSAGRFGERMLGHIESRREDPVGRIVRIVPLAIKRRPRRQRVVEAGRAVERARRVRGRG